MHDAWGVSDGYFDVDGQWYPTSDATRQRLREAIGTPTPGPPMWFVPSGEVHTLWDECHLILEDGTDMGGTDALPGDLPIGYHHLSPIAGGPVTTLVIHPRACPPIPQMWGVSAQIYALWSNNSWGIGDLADLASLARAVAEAGAGALLISPLHQPAPSAPQQDSPYYPSSRRAWNPLLIALDGPRPDGLACSPTELIQRDDVWRAKRLALEQLCANSATPTPLPTRVALWNALCDEFGPDWSSWPLELRRPDDAAIAARLRDHREFAQRAGFHQWCQQVIAEQLDHVRASGTALIGDLAVGFSPNGADAWEYQDLLALDVRIGAPPDPFNADGQEWGIPAFIPWRLRNASYEPFIATVRAALCGVDGLRIDHVMGLFRQFWVPVGSPPSEGAYVSFPAEELLAIIALEATRVGAFVIGEDLGTVGDGVREALAQRNIAGTRVLWFEPGSPATWPQNTLATVTTHDLPTIAGVLTGADGNDEQRQRLLEIDGADDLREAIDQIHAAVLASPARLRLVAVDDLCAAL